MPRKVFFSFHYKNDIRRVVQVRNSGVIRAGDETQPFMDKAEWEKLKRSSHNAIENWIEKQLKGTSVTVVLIGSDTYSRAWVKHEIKRSYELKKGMFGIYIHNIKDPQNGVSRKGKNPFDHWYIEENGRKKYFSEIYPTYDWVSDNGYNNMHKWIEKAAKVAGR
ncbi:MAG: TIR-like domain-containing protein [Pseudomonadales bacterium]|nr:TIR-like domain-containing protein [Pseudomonadales bacterium]MEC8813487.1 TIR domain-containing protein [Pseudomonadota bacterium]